MKKVISKLLVGLLLGVCTLAMQGSAPASAASASSASASSSVSASSSRANVGSGPNASAASLSSSSSASNNYASDHLKQIKSNILGIISLLNQIKSLLANADPLDNRVSMIKERSDAIKANFEHINPQGDLLELRKQFDKESALFDQAKLDNKSEAHTKFLTFLYNSLPILNHFIEQSNKERIMHDMATQTDLQMQDAEQQTELISVDQAVDTTDLQQQEQERQAEQARQEAEILRIQREQEAALALAEQQKQEKRLAKKARIAAEKEKQAQERKKQEQEEQEKLQAELAAASAQAQKKEQEKLIAQAVAQEVAAQMAGAKTENSRLRKELKEAKEALEKLESLQQSAASASTTLQSQQEKELLEQQAKEEEKARLTREAQLQKELEEKAMQAAKEQAIKAQEERERQMQLQAQTQEKEKQLQASSAAASLPIGVQKTKRAKEFGSKLSQTDSEHTRRKMLEIEKAMRFVQAPERKKRAASAVPLTSEFIKEELNSIQGEILNFYVVINKSPERITKNFEVIERMIVATKALKLLIPDGGHRLWYGAMLKIVESYVDNSSTDKDKEILFGVCDMFARISSDLIQRMKKYETSEQTTVAIEIFINEFLRDYEKNFPKFVDLLTQANNASNNAAGSPQIIESAACPVSQESKEAQVELIDESKDRAQQALEDYKKQEAQNFARKYAWCKSAGQAERPLAIFEQKNEAAGKKEFDRLSELFSPQNMQEIIDQTKKFVGIMDVPTDKAKEILAFLEDIIIKRSFYDKGAQFRFVNKFLNPAMKCLNEVIKVENRLHSKEEFKIASAQLDSIVQETHDILKKLLGRAQMFIEIASSK